MSQKRRPTARTARKRRATGVHRNQRLYAILGVIVVISLIGAVIGPPLIDFLTRTDDPSVVDVSDPGSDPVIGDYQTQIAENPVNAEALAALGNYLGQIGRVDEAIPWYEKALALDPENWTTRLGFADALANGDKRADAELQYKKVIAARPNSALAHFSLAQLYANWVPARTADAISEYQSVLRAGTDEFVVVRAAEELAELGVATPIAGTLVASPTDSPVATEVIQ